MHLKDITFFLCKLSDGHNAEYLIRLIVFENKSLIELRKTQSYINILLSNWSNQTCKENKVQLLLLRILIQNLL